jgi:lactobin A/cerein 7B family class IIb bacteriocin
MPQIQITDLNPSDSGLMEELTVKELLAINGGAGPIGDVLRSLGFDLLADVVDIFEAFLN